MPIENVAKSILLDRTGHILLLRRSKNDDNRPGEWDLPGGGVEPGESSVAAAAREALEEAGLALQIKDLRLVYAVTRLSSKGDVSLNRFVFVGLVPAGQAVQLSHEHEEYQWTTVEDALREYTHPVYGEAIRYAHDNALLPKAE